MSLSQCSKLRGLVTRMNLRFYSSPSKDIKKTVFISQSNDVYTNLALEDWIYKNFDFANHHLLMVWRNNPCIVIGRHQNPWLEANIANLNSITENGVQLARRNSGGGTVFHDQGNLNLTFFTAKDQYNRKQNLELISRGIFRKYGVKVEVSPREDLVIRNSKISGTAAKLGRTTAYHHCTLMVNVNKSDLHQSLTTGETGIRTNATESANSKIMNLADECPQVSVDGLLSAIGWEFLRTTPNLIDGGKELALKQNGFQMVNPTEQWFPGLGEIQEILSGWDWCYGKTPNFSVSKSFAVPSHLLNDFNGNNNNLKVTILVEHGRISEVTLYVPPGMSSSGFSGEAKVITSLKGHKFTQDAINSLELSLSGSEYGLVDDKDKFVTECVRQVMTSV